MSSLGVLVAQNKNGMYFFLEMKKKSIDFERKVKEPDFFKL